MELLTEENYPGLPKWPGTIISGEPVTKEQAAEIILRTDYCYFSTNDRDWDAICKKALEYPVENYSREGIQGFLEASQKWEESIGKLEVEYMYNAWIASAYIYGPHGWCDWEGHIGCHYGNTGKWPEVSSVRDDWAKLAEAFPFLKLRCQLMDRELHELGAQPVVEFVVGDGKVDVIAPEEFLAPSYYGAKYSELEAVTALCSSVGRERGCTVEQLLFAKKVCRDKFGNPKSDGALDSLGHNASG